MKYIAVLLTVHNRMDKTKVCLSRLFAQEIPDSYSMDVYLTDDGCTDGTSEVVRKLFPQVHIVQGNGNLYWNRGMWTAWNVASKNRDYDYYLWLNDDTNLYDGAITTLLHNAETCHENAVIVGVTQDAKHTKITYGGRIKGQIPLPKGKPIKVDFFNGNIVLVPQSVFRILGNLDWYYTHSKGDFDYGMRAKKAGIGMYQCGEILGECEAHSSIDKWCNPEISLRKRWMAMWRPNGMPPHETFHFECRHVGFFVASFHYCTVILRCLFPKIWLLKT